VRGVTQEACLQLSNHRAPSAPARSPPYLLFPSISPRKPEPSSPHRTSASPPEKPLLSIFFLVLYVIRAAPQPPHRCPASLLTRAPTRGRHNIRCVVLSLCSEGIEPASTAETATSSSSSPIAGEIRSVRSSFDFPEHARVLAVSSSSFSAISPSVSSSFVDPVADHLFFSVYVLP
jgi:hypothetical protein